MLASEDADGRWRQLHLNCLIGDLSAYPGLATLLIDLKKHTDPSMMTVTYAQPLEEARNEVSVHYANWLKWDSLFQLLQEAFLKLRDDLSLQDKKLLETLEQQLLVAELKRMLEFHSSLPNARPFVLGLETRHLTKCLPPQQHLEEMQKRLPNKLGKILKARCLDMLGYYHLEFDNRAVVKMIQFGTLAVSLATEKEELKAARAQQKELLGNLHQQKMAYSKVLLHCLGLLKQLVSEFHLRVQSEVDQFNIMYIGTKGRAMLLKIRLMELKILSETYTPEIVNVHQEIRKKLQASLSQKERDLATSRKTLFNYGILGPEFEVLIKEYTSLQEKIQKHRWMLTELLKI